MQPTTVATSEAGGDEKRRRTFEAQPIEGAHAEAHAKIGDEASASSSDEAQGEAYAGFLKTMAFDDLVGSDASDDDNAEDPKDDAKLAADDAKPATSASESSSSTSSSSSSSSSDEEDDEDDQLAEFEADEAAEAGIAAIVPLGIEEKRARDLDVVRRVHLRRDELLKMILFLPEEKMEQAIVGSMVKVTVQNLCVLSEVVEIEPSTPYIATRQSGEQDTIRVQLRCKRGTSSKLFKVTLVSNKALRDIEFDQWMRFLERTHAGNRSPIENTMDRLNYQATQILEVRKYSCTPDEIEKILQGRKTLEFQPQQESRMRALMSATLSQLDVTAVRDRDAKEQTDAYNYVVSELGSLEKRSSKAQEEWFDKRANLYSLKEINRKNFFRQQNRDRHALDYVMCSEAAGGATLNPFERRACRPVCAWDTKLTFTEGVDAFVEGDQVPAAPSEDAAAKDAAKSHQKISSNCTESASGARDGVAEAIDAQPSLSRVDSVLRAHRRYTNLLAKLGTVQVS